MSYLGTLIYNRSHTFVQLNKEGEASVVTDTHGGVVVVQQGPDLVYLRITSTEPSGQHRYAYARVSMSNPNVRVTPPGIPFAAELQTTQALNNDPSYLVLHAYHTINRRAKLRTLVNGVTQVQRVVYRPMNHTPLTARSSEQLGTLMRERLLSPLFHPTPEDTPISIAKPNITPPDVSIPTEDPHPIPSFSDAFNNISVSKPTLNPTRPWLERMGEFVPACSSLADPEGIEGQPLAEQATRHTSFVASPSAGTVTTPENEGSSDFEGESYEVNSVCEVEGEEIDSEEDDGKWEDALEGASECGSEFYVSEEELQG